MSQTRQVLNSVEIRGRADRDAVLRRTINGTLVTNFRLRYVFVRRDGVELVSCFDVVQFGPEVEESLRKVRKGNLIEVYGRLEESRWTDKEGAEKSRVQIVAKVIEVIDEMGKVES